MLLNIVEWFTILISLLIAWKCFRKYTSSGVLIVYSLFFAICVLPLVFDHLLGLPDYTIYNLHGRYHGFIISYNDQVTRYLYCGFLLLAQYIIIREGNVKLVFKREKNYQKIRNEYDFEDQFAKGQLDQKMRIASIFLALLPIIIAGIFGPTNILIRFGWRDFHLYDSVIESSWFSFAEKFSYLGVTSSVILLLLKYDKQGAQFFFLRILACASLYLNICIESKRSIIFFAVVIILAVLLYGRGVAFKRLFFYAGMAIIFIILYSVYIKTTARNYIGFEGIYTSLRTDMFRDDTIKFTIYSVLHPDEVHILDFPFQSYLTQIRYFFFITILVGIVKMIPLPGIGFNRYLSSALIGASLSEGYSYMTTSIFDESIANFGFLGFLLSPLLCRIIAKKIDTSSNFEKIFIIGSIVLAMMYSPNYILFFVEFTIWLHLSKYIRFGAD